MHGQSPPLTLYTGRLEEPLRWAECHRNLGVLRRARGVLAARELLAGRFEAALAMLVSGQHAWLMYLHDQEGDPGLRSCAPQYAGPPMHAWNSY
jgi:hypothetical protein